MTADGNLGKSPDRNVSDFCDRFCLSNQITEPTRVTDKTSTLIDVMLSSHPERFATWDNLHLGLSDHDLIYAVRKNKLPRPRPREIEYRSMKSFNESDFLADLADVNLVPRAFPFLSLGRLEKALPPGGHMTFNTQI